MSCRRRVLTMVVGLADKLKKGVRLVIEGERTRLARVFGRSIYSDETFMRSVCDAEQTPRKLAESFRNRRDPRFFVDPADKETILDEFGRRPRWSAESIIEDAEMLCRHKFSMLGAETVDLGNPIDWHRDFKSGGRWRPGMYYKLVSRWRPNGRADIKVPWELSRFQHLPTLGKAYWLTGDERYARELVDQVSDWIARNPVGFGVNWACTMDVSIRAVNWLWGWYFVKESPSIDDRFVLLFLKSLWQHGVHIMDNLEIITFEGKKYKNNHYLADVAGLVYLGLMLPEFRVAAEWFDAGVHALENEIRVQTHEDGPSFEQSVPYHRLALELFMYPALLCRLNGVDMSLGYLHRLERMVEFTAAYTKPDGTAPQIGDADDGRLHIMSEYRRWDRRDHRYLLEIGAKLFGRDEFMSAASQEWEEAFWLTRWMGNRPIAQSRSEPYTL
ncbi:MAG: alginate lyase family protein, partial [Candidatus Hydrogenedentes bacterium]|nr:alginate lyase family protein [Candidatus Hydrogenedentota bacterium]